MFQISPYTVIKADIKALAAHVFEFESKPYHVFCKYNFVRSHEIHVYTF